MRRLAAALMAAMAAAAAGNAHAAPVYAAVTVNGYPTGLIMSLDEDGDTLIATAGDLDRIGLVVPAKAQADARINLASLPNVHATLRGDTQTLVIGAGESALKRHLIGGGEEPSLPDEAAWGALLNYGVSATAATEGTAEFAGDFELRVFGPPGILESSWYADSVDEHGTYLRRLDTALIHDDAASLRTWTAGDFIAVSLPWSRPVRGFGFSLATNFDVRPDLITQPMPRLRGTASVPSTIDLYLDGVHALSAEAPPGPFTVVQPPVVNGAGQVSLAITDTLGRQTIQSFSFYATEKLLAPDLTAYALEGGWLRRDYATLHDRYTEPFAQAMIRRGMNDWLTLEGRVAGTQDILETGAGFVAKIGEFAIVGLSFDGSFGDGRGQQFRVSIERQAGPYFLAASAQQTFGEFRDLATAAGDFPIRRALQAAAGYNSETLGTFGLAFYQQETETRHFADAGAFQAGTTGLVNISWSRPIFSGWTAYATAYRTVAGARTSGFMIGLTYSPGDGMVAAAGVSGTDHHVGAYANASKSPSDAGGWGWNVQARSDVTTDAQGTLRYVSPFGEVGAGVSGGSGTTVGTAYALGSVAWLAGGHPHFARQSGTSFAEVDTEAPGVGVTMENRDMGKTDSDGRLFVPDVISFTASRFAIEPDTVPLGRDILASSATVRPPRNAGVVVHLPVRELHSAAVRLVDANGDPIAVNGSVTLNGQAAGAVGYDGVVWLSNLVATNHIEITDGNGTCAADFPIDLASFQPGRQLGPIACVGH